MPVISQKTLFLNADKTQVVDEGSEDAAFLLVRAGSELNDEDAKRYGVGGEQPRRYDAIADHAAKHGGETVAEAGERRAAMLDGQPDPDGAPVPGERDTLDQPSQGDVKAQEQPRETKAVTKAPANKER